MCGLVGIMGDVYKKEDDVFKLLLSLDTIRGPHSTGVVGVTGQEAINIAKAVGTPWELFDQKHFDKLMNKNNKLLMGHNRYATQGAVNKVNAHPFQWGNITGMHNGTLIRQNLLDDHTMFEVDSENIIYHIDKHGIQDTVSKLHGAYALVWHDKSDNTLNFTRNADRTLYYTLADKGTKLVWASESWMISVACSRNSLEYGEIFPFLIDKHYKFKIKELADKFISDPEVVDVTPYEPPVTNWNKYSRGNTYVGKPQGAREDLSSYVGEEVSFYPVTLGTCSNKVAYVSCKLNSDNDVYLRVYAQQNLDLWKELTEGLGRDFTGKVKSSNYFEGQSYLILDQRTVKMDFTTEDDLTVNGVVVSEQEWKESVKDGCAWCSEVPEPDEHEQVHWIDNTASFICPGCKNLEEVSTYIN